MKRYNTIYTMMLMLGLAVTSFTSCSDDDEGGNLYSAVIASSVEFNLAQDKQMLVYTDETGAQCLPLVKGETLKLDYTVTPDTVTYKDVVWTTSNADFVTVSDDGTVSAYQTPYLHY